MSALFLAAIVLPEVSLRCSDLKSALLRCHLHCYSLPVVSLHWAPCGHCSACAAGKPTHCTNNSKSFVGLTVNGGYAEYAVNGSSGWSKVPNGWSPVEAASVMCTYGTVWHGAITRGRYTTRSHSVYPCSCMGMSCSCSYTYTYTPHTNTTHTYTYTDLYVVCM